MVRRPVEPHAGSRARTLAAAAVVAAFAGAGFLYALSHTSIQPAEQLPTLISRTLQATTPALAPDISPLEVRIWTAQATPEPPAAEPSAPHEIDSAAQATVIKAPPPNVRFKGHLVVDSVPAGARVLINQQPAGVTPLQLTDYPAGSYAVWVEHEGYERWTAGIRIQAHTTTHIRPLLLSKTNHETPDTE